MEGNTVKKYLTTYVSTCRMCLVELIGYTSTEFIMTGPLIMGGTTDGYNKTTDHGIHCPKCGIQYNSDWVNDVENKAYNRFVELSLHSMEHDSCEAGIRSRLDELFECSKSEWIYNLWIKVFVNHKDYINEFLSALGHCPYNHIKDTAREVLGLNVTNESSVWLANSVYAVGLTDIHMQDRIVKCIDSWGIEGSVDTLPFLKDKMEYKNLWGLTPNGVAVINTPWLRDYCTSIIEYFEGKNG